MLDGGAPGLYHRSQAFEQVVRSIEAYVSRAGGARDAAKYYFAPVVPVTTLERTGYAESFPNLLGVINSFDGDEERLSDLRERLARKEGWLELLSPTNVGLSSAACHSLYPLISDIPVPSSGRNYEIQAVCFRHEPNLAPVRMQSFRMHEFVYVGTPVAARSHRDEWLARGGELMRGLGLVVDIVEANDPFFGRAGRLLAAGQVEKGLKFEVVTPLGAEVPTAIASANYHENHFGSSFHLRMSDGTVAHSSCVGFGLERIALALFFYFGFEVADWPTETLKVLGEGLRAPRED